MKSSITKRWVRGSLLFTLAVVLVAEALFLWFTINGYYSSARTAINNQFYTLQGMLNLPSNATTDQKRLRLISTVEQFEGKSQFELMLVHSGGGIYTTSSGIVPLYSETPQDIAQALEAGSSGTGYHVGRNENGEKVMAITMQLPSSVATPNVVAMRLVTSMTLVDAAIINIVVASIGLLAAIVLASVISGVYFIRSIVFPLQKIEATAARIAEGDFDTRIVNDSNDEVGKLSRTINYMAEELSKSERMKNDFISSVSHELRTPLTSIKGWAETLEQLHDPANPNFEKGIGIIKGETDRLYEMVEELLDFSRMQDGLSLSPELLDLAAEVENAVLLCGQRAAGLGVALLYAVPQDPVPVQADKNRLRQVLVNVLDNAIKYSFTGGEVDTEILQDEHNAYVVVSDEGQGIQAEDLENVKVRFYKGKGAMRGSGIGLAVVDEIMGAHDGELTITSELQRGTQVTLRFPLYQPGRTAQGNNGAKHTAPAKELPDGETSST